MNILGRWLGWSLLGAVLVTVARTAHAQDGGHGLPEPTVTSTSPASMELKQILKGLQTANEQTQDLLLALIIVSGAAAVLSLATLLVVAFKVMGKQPRSEDDLPQSGSSQAQTHSLKKDASQKAAGAGPEERQGGANLTKTPKSSRERPRGEPRQDRPAARDGEPRVDIERNPSSRSEDGQGAHRELQTGAPEGQGGPVEGVRPEVEGGLRGGRIPRTVADGSEQNGPRTSPARDGHGAQSPRVDARRGEGVQIADSAGHRPAEARSSKEEDPAGDNLDNRWKDWLDHKRSQRFGAVAVALGRLVSEAEALSKKLTGPENRRELQELLTRRLGPRLKRFDELQKVDESTFFNRWVVPDLLATLDELANCYSAAIEEEQSGVTIAKGLKARLEQCLFDELTRACRQAGWFVIERVVPYQTPFDPSVHRAVGKRAAGDAAGLVVGVKRLGRLDVSSGERIETAQVVVGR